MFYSPPYSRPSYHHCRRVRWRRRQWWCGGVDAFTHWARDEMVANLQTTFSWIKTSSFVLDGLINDKPTLFQMDFLCRIGWCPFFTHKCVHRLLWIKQVSLRSWTVMNEAIECLPLNQQLSRHIPQKSQLSLQWRHNGHDDVSNHQPRDCFLNLLFRRRTKKHQSSASLRIVCEEFTGDRWIPRTKGQ